jgi:ElaB/YqjD/DUF883 family membrane-anchored ribosome-binding protein
MDKKIQSIRDDIGALAEDARALLATTSAVAEEKVDETRERAAAALERGKELYGRVRERAASGAKAADRSLHDHPYQAIGVMVGLGVLAGYLLARCFYRNEDSPGPRE